MNGRIIAYSVMMASASLLFLACGDDITEVNRFDGILTSDSLESLECNDKNDGQLAYIADSAKFFACFDGEWQSVTGAKAANNCSVEPLKKKDGYKVVCGGDSVGVLLSGKDAEEQTCSAKTTKEGIEVTCGGKTIGVLENGESGKSCSVKDTTESKGKKRSGLAVLCGGEVDGVIWNGENGKQGESCSAKQNASGSIEVTCGGKTIGVLENGESGKSCSVKDTTETSGKKRSGLAVLCSGEVSGVIWNGENGEQGESCYIDAVNSVGGLVKMVCGEDTTTLYKAFCGGKPYDPEKQFCYIDSIVDLCGGEIYDIEGFFCVDDTTYEICYRWEDGEYMPIDYNPKTEICVYNGWDEAHKAKRFATCQEIDSDFGDIFMPSSTHILPEFSSNDDTFDRFVYFCGTNEDDTYEIAKRCGDEYDGEYYIGDSFCYNDVIYSKCGSENEEYNPEIEFCYGYEEVRELCGGNRYSEYGFCYNDSVYSKCRLDNDNGIMFGDYGEEYNPETQFCSDVGEVEDFCSGKEFSPMNNELCDNGVIKKICFQEYDYAKEIDPTKQFCGNMNVLDIKEYCDDGLPVDDTYFYCEDSDDDGLSERRGGDY